MFFQIVRSVKLNLVKLFVCDLLFKVIAFILLTPFIGFTFHLFLAASGRSVLADADIAKFFLHPIGWLAFVLVGGASVCVFAIEQAIMLVVLLTARNGHALRPSRTVLFVLQHMSQLLRLTCRMVAWLGCLAFPFLAVGGTIFWLLLTDHDINFYLTAKPPKFWLAVGLIAAVLLGLAITWVRRIASWSLALPILLFEDRNPRESLLESCHRTRGKLKPIAFAFVCWGVGSGLMGMALSAIALWIGQSIVPHFTGSLWMLVLAVGSVAMLVTLANWTANFMSNATCAALVTELYFQFAAPEQFNFDRFPAPEQKIWQINMSRRALVLTLGLLGLAAALVGSSVFRGIQLVDRVEITAHRGGAGNGPENTLAAIRQSIEQGTDWIEIDVQESRDGVVMVAHDSDLKKVAGNPVKIWEASAAELRAIDIGSYFSTEFSDQRMPTLEEVLVACKGRAKVNIELKYYGHTQSLEQRVVELVEKHQMQSEIVIMSLDSQGLRRMKQLRPDWTAGLLTAVAVGDLTRASADFLAVNRKLATRKFIANSHNRSKPVYVWTINDGYAMSAMMSRGANNIITDFPLRARRVLDQRARLSTPERLMVELAFYLGLKTPVGGEP